MPKKKAKKKGPIRASKALIKASERPERLLARQKRKHPVTPRKKRGSGEAGGRAPKMFEAAFSKLRKRGATSTEAAVGAKFTTQEARDKLAARKGVPADKAKKIMARIKRDIATKKKAHKKK